MNHICIQYYKTPFGELVLGSYSEQLCLCDWRYRKMRTTIDNRITQGLDASFVQRDSVVLRETKKQLNEYFSHSRRLFSIPLLLVGTEFQKSVWNKLLQLPFGQTTNYLQLAERLGNKNAVRAVASANGANAISIIVPCHRVIGRNGQLVGYAGGLTAKRKLLALEQDLFVT